MSLRIDGKKISSDIKEELKEQVKQLKEEGISVCLAVIQVGNDPASSVYVNNKKKACASIGIESQAYELPEETTQEELLALIDRLNKDDHVNGILVQLPIPMHMDEKEIIQAISPAKDVDGFHPQNVGALSTGEPGFVSCTPAGIIQLLKRSGISIDGIVSSQLLINIFEHNTPLHDGAVIIRGNRIVSATCYLPLTDSMDIGKELGTRHRAAVGISEVSDSMTIIVSEETGAVSLAKDGRLYKHLQKDELLEKLKELKVEDANNTDVLKKWKDLLRNEKSEK